MGKYYDSLPTGIRELIAGQSQKRQSLYQPSPDDSWGAIVDYADETTEFCAMDAQAIAGLIHNAEKREPGKGTLLIEELKAHKPSETLPGTVLSPLSYEIHVDSIVAAYEALNVSSPPAGPLDDPKAMGGPNRSR